MCIFLIGLGEWQWPPMTCWKVNGDGVRPVVDTIILLQHRYPLHNILRPYIKTSYRLLNISRIFMNILLIFTNSKARQSCLSEKFFRIRLSVKPSKSDSIKNQNNMNSKCTHCESSMKEKTHLERKAIHFPFYWQPLIEEQFVAAWMTPT